MMRIVSGLKTDPYPADTQRMIERSTIRPNKTVEVMKSVKKM
jgi:hypothetical protein